MRGISIVSDERSLYHARSDLEGEWISLYFILFESVLTTGPRRVLRGRVPERCVSEIDGCGCGIVGTGWVGEYCANDEGCVGVECAAADNHNSPALVVCGMGGAHGFSW